MALDNGTTQMTAAEIEATTARGPPPAPDYHDVACWAAFPGELSPCVHHLCFHRAAGLR